MATGDLHGAYNGSPKTRPHLEVVRGSRTSKNRAIESNHRLVSDSVVWGSVASKRANDKEQPENRPLEIVALHMDNDARNCWDRIGGPGL